MNRVLLRPRFGTFLLKRGLASKELSKSWKNSNCKLSSIFIIFNLDNDQQTYGIWIASGSVASVLIASYFIDQKRHTVHASTFVDLKPPPRPDLPDYKLEEIKKHGKDADRKWVMFKEV